MDKRKIKKSYYNLALPSSYSSIENLRKVTGLPKSQVIKWLSAQDTYTLHKPIRKRFPRNPYMVNNIDDIWELDLVDLSNLKKFNQGYRYLLNSIDTFSKFAWSIPMKDKKGPTVTLAFQSILEKSNRSPRIVQTDMGGEFMSRKFQFFLKSRNIEFRTTKNPDIKAAIVERYNRTQKTRMYKYFTHNNTYNYLTILDKLLDSYNKTVHSTIGMAPAKVTSRDVFTIWKRMLMKRNRIKRGCVKFKVGDYVRIGKQKKTFDKGYEENYTTEIFKVVKVIPRIPQPLYELVDLNDQPIDGRFYNYELVLTHMDSQTIFKIDKILETRNKNGIREHLVQWQGYDRSYNSWCKSSDLIQLKKSK